MKAEMEEGQKAGCYEDANAQVVQSNCAAVIIGSIMAVIGDG